MVIVRVRARRARTHAKRARDEIIEHMGALKRITKLSRNKERERDEGVNHSRFYCTGRLKIFPY